MDYALIRTVPLISLPGKRVKGTVATIALLQGDNFYPVRKISEPPEQKFCKDSEKIYFSGSRVRTPDLRLGVNPNPKFNSVRMKKKILPGIVIILIVIQFIRPAKNISSEATPNEISLHYTVPDEVHAMLKHSCYDCHSNNTVYPWYANVQPFGWWIQSDINEAKHHLNFSTFGSYSGKNKRWRLLSTACHPPPNKNQLVCPGGRAVSASYG